MEFFKLTDGREIPAVGFGCYNAKGGDNYRIISDAIKSGYRFFDTASLYETERALGQAIKDSGIPREEFFIQSKLWLDEMGYDEAKAALKRSLERLQMDYIDVYLIHWPRQCPVQEGAPGHPEVVPGKRNFAQNEDWKSLQKETYKAMEEMYDVGLIRGIGLSNFLPHHLMNIYSFCRVDPVVVQLEMHVGYTQATAVRYAQDKGLVVQAWSPLARGAVFEEPFFKKMADKYNVSLAQLALRFVYQSGVLALPKATAPERQLANMNIFDFEISEEDFYLLACMVPNCWQNEHPDFVIPGKDCSRDQ